MKTVTLLFSFLMLFNIFTFGHDKRTSLPGASVAFAFPVSKIIVDGDTSDWPKKCFKYPIENIYENKLSGKEDVSAYFQVGYNLSEQALFFFVVVSDDSHIIDTSKNARTDTQDTYCLYLDNKNLPAGSGKILWPRDRIGKNALWICF